MEQKSGYVLMTLGLTILTITEAGDYGKFSTEFRFDVTMMDFMTLATDMKLESLCWPDSCCTQEGNCENVPATISSASVTKVTSGVTARRQSDCQPPPKDCVFPFIYKGETYYSCTGTIGKRRAWCATKVNAHWHFVGELTYCDDVCDVTEIKGSEIFKVKKDKCKPPPDECLFPFIFRGQSYNTCVKGYTSSWCATEVNKDGHYIGKWTTCDNLCEDPNERVACTPGTVWKNDCNDCWCTERGVPRCTKRICSPDHVLPKDAAVQCIPGTKWKKDCNSCFCTALGVPKCSDSPCETDDSAHTSEADTLQSTAAAPASPQSSAAAAMFSHSSEAEAVSMHSSPAEADKCTPGSMWKQDCNECFCTKRGEPKCSNRLCDSAGNCTPGTSWKDDCNECFCTDQRVPKCSNQTCLSDKATSVPKEQDVKCTPGSRWKEECNTCFCTDESKPLCTKKSCVSADRPATATDSSPAAADSFPAAAGSSPAAADRCTPGTRWKVGCNDCFCTGRREPECNKNKCLSDQPIEDMTVQEVKCVPGFRWTEDCNSCFCTRQGQPRCTETKCESEKTRKGTCPWWDYVVKDQSVGTCVSDSECPEEERCCPVRVSAPSRRTCRPVTQDKEEPREGPCPQWDYLLPDRGVSGCVLDSECPEEEKCCPVQVSDTNRRACRPLTPHKETKYAKPGQCPQWDLVLWESREIRSCRYDSDCPHREKCCADVIRNSSTLICRASVSKRVKLRQGKCPWWDYSAKVKSPTCVSDSECPEEERCCPVRVSAPSRRTCQAVIPDIDSTAIKPGDCPHWDLIAVQNANTQSCRYDNECPHNEKCCAASNNFPEALICRGSIPNKGTKGFKPGQCPQFDFTFLDNRDTRFCTYDSECHHKEKCCVASISYPETLVCRLSIVRKDAMVVKTGQCPQHDFSFEDNTDIRTCSYDGDCPDRKKCCAASKRYPDILVCQHPVFQIEKPKQGRCPWWVYSPSDTKFDDCISDNECSENEKCCPVQIVVPDRKICRPLLPHKDMCQYDGQLLGESSCTICICKELNCEIYEMECPWDLNLDYILKGCTPKYMPGKCCPEIICPDQMSLPVFY